MVKASVEVEVEPTGNVMDVAPDIWGGLGCLTSAGVTELEIAEAAPVPNAVGCRDRKCVSRAVCQTGYGDGTCRACCCKSSGACCDGIACYHRAAVIGENGSLSVARRCCTDYRCIRDGGRVHLHTIDCNNSCACEVCRAASGNGIGDCQSVYATLV